MAQTERNDWHKSIETGGIVYSETVALLMRRMHQTNDKFDSSVEEVKSELTSTRNSFEALTQNIEKTYKKLEQDTFHTNDELNTIKTKIDTLSKDISNLRNRLDSNQNVLINLLEMDQKKNTRLYYVMIGLLAITVILLLLIYTK